ncbi:hypothetical protein KQH62_03655 [bacterium]|nr:hypothetical protein [bacterium]
MKTKPKLHIANLILGLLSCALFIFNGVMIFRLRPKMEAYQTLATWEMNMLTVMGFGLLLVLVFLGLTLLQVLKSIRRADHFPVGLAALFTLTVITALLIVSDVVLLRDIANQFEDGFAQPEWGLVIPMMVGQFLMVVLLLVLHTSDFFTRRPENEVARDSNIFTIVQIVGVISGAMGMGMASLGFIYPRSWSPLIHTVMGSVVALVPYLIILIYWLVQKSKEPDRKLFDEKQRLDVGRSAMLTLVVTALMMTGLYISQFNALDGIVRYLWLPFDLFGVVLVFSIGYLIYSRQP